MLLNMLTKLTRKKGGGVGQMLTLADKGGRGGRGNAHIGIQRGERGSGPPFLADIICEQPLIWQKYIIVIQCESHRHYLDIDITQSILKKPSGPQSNAIKYKFMTWIWSLFCLQMSSHTHFRGTKANY